MLRESGRVHDFAGSGFMLLPTNELDPGWSCGALPPAPCRWDKLWRTSCSGCRLFRASEALRLPASGLGKSLHLTAKALVDAGHLYPTLIVRRVR